MPSGEYLQIIIKDSGVGISEKDMQHIFKRYKHSSKTKPIDSASTGIGLSLVQELIDLHKGEIKAQSVEDIGSAFTILLPIYKEKPEIEGSEEGISEKDVQGYNKIEPNKETKKLSLNSSHNQKPIILIVEDNSDLRAFLSNEFKEYYKILQSNNGEDGLKIALQAIPDLILSDIMMDKADGISMCKQLKADEKTSHIPIVLLTARHADNVKLNCYQLGADDYITKPFNIEILKTRIDNIITQRQKLRATFSLGIDNKHTIDVKDSMASKFLNKLNQTINENIDAPNLSPTFLASEMAMSRMQLYRKVTALTNQTVNNYIRTIKLNKAVQLLLTTDLQVSEVAFKVGFSEPSNFTKSFVTQFHQTPTQFIKSHKETLSKNSNPKA